METYNTLSEAITDLKRKGYTEDLNVEHAYITHKEGGHFLYPSDFHVDEFFRFEDNTDPSDQAILYAISSEKFHLKGLLVNAYGLNTESFADELMEKLKTH